MKNDINKQRSLNESILEVYNRSITNTDYIEMLETVLISIADHLGYNPEDLVEEVLGEDVQTPARTKEMKSRLASTAKAIKEDLQTHERKLEMKRKSAAAWDKEWEEFADPKERALKKARKIDRTNDQESRDRTNVYGKGGKIVGIVHKPRNR